ncbi:MAG TPA: hypothetical protein VFV77_03260, partial [Gammaproteobacteria bacterium]|nr:hypothetical protein [Gammaproteobacteria bacterium]
LRGTRGLDHQGLEFFQGRQQPILLLSQLKRLAVIKGILPGKTLGGNASLPDQAGVFVLNGGTIG